jgi:glutaredoxin
MKLSCKNAEYKLIDNIEQLEMLVEIYSKNDCCLCDEAKAIIEKVRKITPFDFKETDITKDENLFEKYKYEIPIIFLNGRKIFKYKVDEKEFIKKLERVSE